MTPCKAKKEIQMQAVQIDELELFEGWSQGDAGMRVRAGFPISSGTGTKSTAVVYFELQPGEHLGSHTDSAEEILLILEGKGEATIGEEQAAVQAGTLAAVPALTPHSSAAQRSSGPDSARKHHGPRKRAGFRAGMRPARFELATSASAGQRSIP